MVSVFMLTGCVEEFEAELPKDDTRLLVVSGTIKSCEVNTFRLTWTTPLNSDMVTTYRDEKYNLYTVTKLDPVYHATVKVCGSDGSEYYCNSVDSGEESPTGLYVCPLPVLKKDVEYYLYIKVGNDVYQSIPAKPLPTPEVEEFTYVQEDSLADIDFVVSTATPEDPSQASYFMWDYKETWEVRPRLPVGVYFDLELLEFFNKNIFPRHGWKFNESKEILIGSTVHYSNGKFSKYKLYEIPRDDERIFWYYHSNLTQRAISKEEYEYQQAVYQAGWEMGGLFTPQPSALPTNIHCTTSNKKVIGYVGCSLNTFEYGMYLDGFKISREIKRHLPIEKEFNPTPLECYDRITQQNKLLYAYVDERYKKDGNLTVWWAENVDIDIRLEGASTERPWYMPSYDDEY